MNQSFYCIKKSNENLLKFYNLNIDKNICWF